MGIGEIRENLAKCIQIYEAKKNEQSENKVQHKASLFDRFKYDLQGATDPKPQQAKQTAIRGGETKFREANVVEWIRKLYSLDDYERNKYPYYYDESAFDCGEKPATEEPVQGEPVQEEPIQEEPIQEEPRKEEPVTDVSYQNRFRASAKDMGLLERYGVSQTQNNPNGPAQFVVGDEAGEVEIEGMSVDERQSVYGLFDKGEDARVIKITDNTNGKKNTYVYRALTYKEKKYGETDDGKKISYENFDMDKMYYVLESVVDENGVDLMEKDHLEIFRLEKSYNKDEDTVNFDLIQDEDMDGVNKSSMDYSRRARS